MKGSEIGPERAVAIFLAFALAYFFSALIRSITATLSPILTAELGLQEGDLGLLAGGYFLGFALMQLPLGLWLDRWGAKRVNVLLLTAAVLGCFVFSQAESFYGLMAARTLIGIGVSACLIASLTGFRHWLSPENQHRANSWMLMTGSLGMLASTLPVQWLLPVLGWRSLFMILGGMFLVAMAVQLWQVPKTHPDHPHSDQPKGYGSIFAHPYFKKMLWIGLINYGGMLSIQTLWSVPWMMHVGGYTAAQAAAGLFAINLAMLCTFWTWGWIAPKLYKNGWPVERLILWGVPLNVIFLLTLIWGSSPARLPAELLLVGFCVSSTAASLAQPAVGQAFSKEWAGRALSAYNLIIFIGVFAMQWGIGLTVDFFQSLGLDKAQAFQGAFSVYACLCLIAYFHFISSRNTSAASPS
jgi:predicted MFS family arabinose efflux permease